MSILSFSNGTKVVPASFLVCLPIGLLTSLQIFWMPYAVAQAVQEVVITGNPLSKSDNPNNVSSLSGLALVQQGQSTLGETLNQLPGVSSTYFGPNASRPIVRGLDGDRIRVLSNSGASLDVSSLSYDHAVPVDVLSTERIEVLKGPAALQYGGSAMGGVVNVIDNRIPRQAMQGVLGKAQLQAATGNQELSKGALIEVGQGSWVFHADAFDRKTGDVKVPRALPCSKPGSPELSRSICNSASASNGGAIGASLFLDDGFIGLSHNVYQSSYGTVAEDTVNIGMRSARTALEGEWRLKSNWLQKLSFQASQSDYKHTEFDAGEAGTVFANKGHDIRIQARHQRIKLGQGALDGVWGWQSEHGQFSADGAEAFAPFSNNRMQGLFFIEEYRVGPASFNLGLRQEEVKVQSLGNPDPTIHRFEMGTRRFQPQSFAISAAWQLNSPWRLTSNLSVTQRAPKDYELFANGPHIATAAWEKGNSQLGIEKAKSLDVSVDWRQGAHQFKLTAFQSRFANFIGLMSTTDYEEGLPVQVYEGVRAKFSGYEASGQWRLLQGTGNLDSTLKVDSVRAINLNTLEQLPRIAPLRLASSLIYSNGPWRASLGFHWHAAQNNIPTGSVATEAYTLWSGHINYKQKVSGQTLNWFAKLDNLSNQWAYSATSILTSTAPGKAPLPGRSLKLGVLATF